MDSKVRLLPVIAVALILTAPGAARPDEPGDDAHAAVRAALLDAATVPALPGHDGERDERWAREGARHAAEREAHERAVDHGRRHGVEAGAEHGPRGSGSPHGGPGSSATMDGSLDCHDPAGNDRTRDMHDGERDPDGPHHR